MSVDLPLLIEPEQLETLSAHNNIALIDLSRATTHAKLHIPGAIHLDYTAIVAHRPPVSGLLPTANDLSTAFASIGLTPESHIIAYDDEGGGKACRLLWSLDCIGHSHYSLLNGGLHAWLNENHAVSTDSTSVTPSHYPVTIRADAPARADTDFILSHLDDPEVALLDARSAGEYNNEKRFALHGGHIPGAINIEWTAFMDSGKNLRMRSKEELRHMLSEAGFHPEQTVVTYCQTHHRSAYTWFVLKYLGYNARGYEGSWSDWGNRHDTPIAQ